MQIRQIISAIEAFASPALQESWDNTGLQVGDATAECTGVLLCLDPTEDVVAEAVAKGCNLVVSHHPLLFKGLKRITGATPSERCVMEAIRHNVAVYSAHTSLDSAAGGVSHMLASALGADVIRVLHPAADTLLRFTIYAPRDKAADVRTALADAAYYDTTHGVVAAECENSVADAGEEDGLPVVSISHTPLTSFSLTVQPSRRNDMENALLGMGDAVCDYTVQSLGQSDLNTGLGVVAILPDAVSAEEFVELVKKACGTSTVRCSADISRYGAIRRIAVCGGSGGEFIGAAVRAGADAYLTADVRYHDFGEWNDRIFIVDAGHYETENCTKTLFMRLIKEKFANFAVYISETEKNPINYL